MAMEERSRVSYCYRKWKTPWETQQGPFDEKYFATYLKKSGHYMFQAVDHWFPGNPDTKSNNFNFNQLAFRRM